MHAIAICKSRILSNDNKGIDSRTEEVTATPGAGEIGLHGYRCSENVCDFY
jgi:hypothetical protein